MSVNPWINMPECSQRRVNTEVKHNIFWITDLEGHYGFCIRGRTFLEECNDLENLKGITIIKRNSELFLILNKNEDWQIFYSLCEDLLLIANKFKKEEDMIKVVEIRLKRWRQFLKINVSKGMSVEQQMGLFSELTCLKEIIIPKYGVDQAVVFWVGPDSDKQDFLLDNTIIEVKSYSTSKGPIVNISSAQQLHSDKEPLFLLTYGLTRSDNGLSIENQVEVIREMLEDKSIELNEMFENKLLNYGYFPEYLKKQLIKFIIDKKRAYFVSNKFPKIPLDQINSQITSIKYTIDLSKCEEYRVKIKSLFNRGE